MYTHVWNKYLPVIKILLKRAVNEEQVLKLDVSDFDKTGSARKGVAFSLIFKNGRRDNLAAISPAAKDLVPLLLQEPMVCELFSRDEYHLSMNTKFVLTMKVVPKVTELAELPLVLEETV